jgi:hypothetical protein
MPFPNSEFCIICEGIRPEIGGKVTILGFYGVAPHVEILVPVLGALTSFSFLIGFAPPQTDVSQNQSYFTVTAPSGNRLIYTQPAFLRGVPGKRIVVAFTTPLIPESGQHILRVHGDTEILFETTFSVRAATANELRDAGIPQDRN